MQILLLLGEVGGVEYRVIGRSERSNHQANRCMGCGACASMFKTEVQMGHAGASEANSQLKLPR